MAYTNFGKILRKKMIDKEENLLNLAEVLNVTTPFVSSVMTGKKSIPESWVDVLSNHFQLNEKEKSELYDAYLEDKTNVKIEVSQLDLSQKKCAIQFQRKLGGLSDEEINQILEILSKGD